VAPTLFAAVLRYIMQVCSLQGFLSSIWGVGNSM